MNECFTETIDQSSMTFDRLTVQRGVLLECAIERVVSPHAHSMHSRPTHVAGLMTTQAAFWCAYLVIDSEVERREAIVR